MQPFKSTSANVEIAALAEGLSEEIVTGLSRFSYLKVIARRSMPTASSSFDTNPALDADRRARFLIDGSIRLSGSVLRVSAQLLDATTGAHLWAETYERPFQPDQIFALQDDLIPRIVSTCADRFGVLARSICDAVRARDASQLSPYEALMRGFGYHHRLSPVDHADARDVLERAVEQAPAHADCWAMLSWIYSHEVGHGFNPRPGSLDRALAAAQRAVELAPSNHLAYQALAVARFFRKEKSACLSAAERALALNPLDASNEAMFLIAFTGDWERGCRLIRKAMDLNPQHPGWYRVVLALNEYRNGNYRDAVKETVAANAPGVFWTNVMLAAAHAQLGELDAARGALQALLAQKPDLVASGRGMLETLVRRRCRHPCRRRTAEGGSWHWLVACHRSSPTGGRRLLGRGVAAQAQRIERGARGSGRGPRRRHRHRAFAVLVPPRDRARFGREARQRRHRHSRDRRRDRRALCPGRQRQAGRLAVTRRDAARRCDDRRASLGRNLQPIVSP